MLNANRVKTDLIYWLLYKKQYQLALTEWGNQADVFAVKRSLYTTEIEIKLSLSDFKPELNSIKAIRDSINPNDFTTCNKYSKHRAYLNNEQRQPYWQNTNEFCFCIPENLLTIAKKELEGTPYGLLLYKDTFEYYIENIKEIIKPKKLNKNKIQAVDFLSLSRRLTDECQLLRQKLYWERNK